jgi:hypothetical protein
MAASSRTQAAGLIGPQEYAFFSSAHKAEVFRYFAAKYGAEDGPGFWKGSYGGESPDAILRERTLLEISAGKAVLKLAQAHGLIADISHAAFLRSMEEENLRRKARIDSGQVVYGPAQWDAFSFFHYRQSNLELAIKREIAEDSRWTGEARLAAAWDSLRSSVFAEDSLSFILITARPAHRGEKRGAAANRLRRIKKAIDSSGWLGARALEAFRTRDVGIDTMSIRIAVSARDGDGEAPSDRDMALRRLVPGQAGDVEWSGDSARLPICLDRIRGFQTYELAKPTLRRMLVDEAFAARISESHRDFAHGIEGRIQNRSGQ